MKKDHLSQAAHFGRPAGPKKLALIEWTTRRTEAPLLREAAAWFECRVVNEYPAGDHVLILGKVIDGALVDARAEPMAYRDTGAIDGASAMFHEHFSDPRDELTGQDAE